MTLEEIRKEIDAIDPKIRALLMERLDCAYRVAEAKNISGDLRVYRPDREEEILARLSEEVPESKKAGYLAVVRKIMQASRMYQYGLLYDWNEGLFDPLIGDITVPGNASRVRVRLSRPDRPNSMSEILSMIGDYGYNMELMELTEVNREEGTVTFELTILGNLNETNMKKLMFQLSMESLKFSIEDVGECRNASAFLPRRAWCEAPSFLRVYLISKETGIVR